MCFLLRHGSPTRVFLVWWWEYQYQTVSEWFSAGSQTCNKQHCHLFLLLHTYILWYGNSLSYPIYGFCTLNPLLLESVWNSIFFKYFHVILSTSTCILLRGYLFTVRFYQYLYNLKIQKKFWPKFRLFT